MFPSSVRAQLSNINVQINAATPDVIAWGGSANGIYTAKAGFDWISKRSHDLLAGQDSWTWIWKLKVVEKIKFLVWLVLHRSLPCNSTRFSRNLSASNLCSRCNLEEETPIHCLRNCPWAARIWEAFGYNVAAADDDVVAWFRCAANASDIKFFSVLWFVWRDRCRHCLEGTYRSLTAICFDIHQLYTDMLHLLAAVRVPVAPRIVVWEAPQEGQVMVNVDGSSLGNPGTSGFGGLIRDHNGHWLFGFAGYVGIATNILAELCGIYNGLCMAWECGFRNILCSSDCLEVISLINGEVSRFHKYFAIIQNINDLLQLEWQVVIKHVLREGNYAADCLAKWGGSQPHPLVRLRCAPAFVRCFLLSDAMGVAHQRP